MGETRLGWLRGLTVAHRGLHRASHLGAGLAENSPGAIEAAVRFGMAVECDVQISADGQAMVFHDFDLDRLTHVQGPTAAHSAQVLGRVPVAGTRDTIPTLPQVLEIIAGRSALLIEVKLKPEQPHAPLCRAVAEALAAYQGPVAVMSFDQRVPKWFLQEAPEVARGLVIGRKDMTGWRATRMSRWTLPRSHAEFVAVDIGGLPSPAAAQWRDAMPLATWTIRRESQRNLALVHADTLIAEGDGLP